MRTIAITVCMLLLSVAAAHAQTQKIGVCNMTEVFQKSVPGEKAMSQLQNKYKGMKEELETKKKNLEEMRQDMQKQSMVLSQEAKRNKEVEFMKQSRDLQGLFQTYQEQMKGEEDRLSKPILETLQEVLGEYGNDNGFAVILDTRNSGIVFADDTIDVTDEIISELNKAWKNRQDK
jgi:outer membrane protein